jgi:hypothetical protein
MKSHPPPKASSSNNDDGDAGLYVRPLSIKILVPVSLGVASVVAVISLYLGNEAVVTAGNGTSLRVWGIRVLVLISASVAGWYVTRRRRRRPE